MVVKNIMDFLKKNIASLVIIMAGVIAIFAVSYIHSTNALPLPENNIISTNFIVLSADEVGERTIAYINEYLLQSPSTASLIGIVEENKVYKLKVKIDSNEFDLYASLDGGLLFPEVIKLEEKTKEETTIGNFTAGENQICEENGKPIIYFFGSPGCPHCVWEHPIVEKAVAQFGDEIAFHNNMDATKDMDVFSQYSTGGVPTTVLGCKYWRVGSGQSNGEEEEARILTALICKLTNNQPEGVCSGVQDLISQLE